MQSQIHAHIQEHVDFIGLPINPLQTSGQSKTDEVRLLDYACGTGLVSRALAPHITSTTGIDISSSMALKFNETFSSPEAPCAGSAIVGDLFTDPPSSELEKPELYDFDVAAIGLGFHHFADPKLAVKRLVDRVKKGSGVLLIIDWLPEDAGDREHHAHGHGHRHQHEHGHQHGQGHGSGAEATIRTHGFSEEDMRSLFEGAGCTDFGFSLMPEPVELFMGEEPNVKRKVKKVFLARARRA